MPRTLRRSACLLVAALLLLGAAPRAGAEDERNLEPIPRMVVFSDIADGARDLETQGVIERHLEGSFASLGDVVSARDLLVKRFGVISVPALVVMLQKNSAHPHAENAALTAGALRDTEGPALELKATLGPLVRILRKSASPYERAFAAIALGCFHWREAEVPQVYKDRAGWYAAVPGPQEQIERAAENLSEARQQLLSFSNDARAFARVSALLALAKSGGPHVRKAYGEHRLDRFANAAPHRADLLTRAFLVMGDPKPYLDGLRAPERTIRASAALAVSVALLQERRPKWTHDAAPLLKALKSTHIKPALEDGVEAVFARGVCALQNQANDEWREIWKLATLDTTNRNVAEAAVQILRFCDLPWFRDEVVAWVTAPPSKLKDPVLAMVLLRAGERGSAEAIDALEDWLRNGAIRPTPTARWDPRWYVAIGLLRALHAGRIRSKPDRVRVVEALRRSASKIMDRKAPFRDALTRLLDAHGDRLAGAEEKALYRLPRADLRRIEASFTCPHDLMTRDVIDACVRRVNATVQDVFGLNGIKPWKPGEPQKTQMPERFLKRYLDSYPYFSRLEFLEGRGARPYPQLGSEREGIDR